VEARGVLLGERIETRGFEPPGILSLNPLAFRSSKGGLVAIYRFGALVFVGVDAPEQDQVVELLRSRVIDAAQPIETEIATLVAVEGGEDNVIGSGKVALVDFSESRLLIVADALAKSVALADDERYVTKVFERIEPFAQNLATTGGTELTTKALLKLLGEALVAQARMVGRVEVQEKPDMLWDRPDFQRLYARLADEYELDDRARALSRKLKVIEESASTLADVTNARRTLRFETAVVALIAVEIVLSVFEIVRSFHRI
jgi:required for meiotic nuclear division protein 1